MKKQVYYAVFGQDGFGVYTNLGWAKNIAGHLKNPQIITCHSRIQAFQMAKDNYNDYQLGSDLDSPFYGDSLETKLNQILFRSEIRKRNRTT